MKKIRERIQLFWAAFHNVRTVVFLGWLGIALAVVSLATRSPLVLVSIAIGVGVIAQTLVAIYCMLKNLVNGLNGGKAFTARTETQTVAAPQSAITH
jgi:hypothetical protein